VITDDETRINYRYNACFATFVVVLVKHVRIEIRFSPETSFRWLAAFAFLHLYAQLQAVSKEQSVSWQQQQQEK
jgi:hypothetical protein